MNLIGRAAQVWVPKPAREILLVKLFKGTAAAFGRPLTPVHTLEAFAEFTARAAAESVPSSSFALSQRLFDVTYSYGHWLRRAFGVASITDVMAAARVVYDLIGIDFHGDARGEISIGRCFFSSRYTPDVCRLMSALDAGLLAGLSAGGRLGFSRRITEGYASCCARLAISD